MSVVVGRNPQLRFAAMAITCSGENSGVLLVDLLPQFT
jgi:hypothetical protein